MWQQKAHLTTNKCDLRRLKCERVWVRDVVTGGGLTGPLRIDLAGRFAGSCMRAYGEVEARQAFQRVAAQHSAVGWEPAGGSGGLGGASCSLPPLLVIMRVAR